MSPKKLFKHVAVLTMLQIIYALDAFTDNIPVQIDTGILEEIAESKGNILIKLMEAFPSVSPSTSKPTNFPTNKPSVFSSGFPSLQLSESPSQSSEPSEVPTSIPSSFSSLSPTLLPSSESSVFPTLSPTVTSLPSLKPSSFPTMIPSTNPTVFSSSQPSDTPSVLSSTEPSEFPSTIPSTFPTTSHPTNNPTNHPTSSFEPTQTRSRSYWNYNPKSMYGPKKWDDTRGGDPIFKKITGSSSNRCDSSSRQSPIILVEDSECEDDHQTHTQRGNHHFEEVEFEVLPHALRAIFPKDEGSGHRAPRADFSNLSEFIPAAYMDVKIPSEHKVVDERGLLKSYPGEIHIAHDWGSKIVIMGFFFDYELDEHNEQLEDFILKWEDIFFKQEHECANLKTSNPSPYEPKFRKRSMDEMIEIWGDEDDWPGDADFDLYRLLPSVFYFGYEGSITAPPCTKDVYWRFQDLPMKISHDQYLRIQRIILDQKDENCRRASKAFNGGVNRPIQKTTQHVWRCTAKHWDVKYPEKWCGKWSEDYHGWRRIADFCSKRN